MQGVTVPGLNPTSSTSTTTVVEQPKAKDLKKKYGIHKAPLLVSSEAIAFRRDMNFDEQFKVGPNKQVTHSWIVLDPSRNLLIRANTYNGGLGEKVDYLNPANVRAIPGFQVDATTGAPIVDAEGQPVPTKERKNALKGYSPIALTEVPFITVAPKAEEKEEDAEQPTEEKTNEDAPPKEEGEQAE